MSLGSIDRTPPPFFRQGPSALTKFALFSALAVFLMAADTRFQMTQPLRAAVATALLPAQRALMAPVDLMADAGDHVQGLRAARSAEAAARAELARLSLRAAQVERLGDENARLRALLDLKPALAVKAISAQVMYEAADPYSRKLFIDRGAANGVVAGSPVVNELGVVGQVTRVYPLTSIVTLLSDRDAAIPVYNARSQQRSAAFGGVEGGMELRFMAGNADVQAGDVLTTSGVDGIYPPGLSVGRVTRVDRRADTGFARVVVTPSVKLDSVRHLLVLEPIGRQLPAPPAPEPVPDKPGKASKGPKP
ncbi:MAG: rod shape-determining protein MreC [Ideonella sp.]|jgi:rod shape-determining protein MreC|nr:rod shape-determining protein MreC [Ideonella sp.]MBL0151330.1 rod shape-determining protein MreC [Ideonella sp.]